MVARRRLRERRRGGCLPRPRRARRPALVTVVLLPGHLVGPGRDHPHHLPRPRRPPDRPQLLPDRHEQPQHAPLPGHGPSPAPGLRERSLRLDRRTRRPGVGRPVRRHRHPPGGDRRAAPRGGGPGGRGGGPDGGAPGGGAGAPGPGAGSHGPGGRGPAGDPGTAKVARQRIETLQGDAGAAPGVVAAAALVDEKLEVAEEGLLAAAGIAVDAWTEGGGHTAGGLLAGRRGGLARGPAAGGRGAGGGRHRDRRRRADRGGPGGLRHRRRGVDLQPVLDGRARRSARRPDPRDRASSPTWAFDVVAPPATPSRRSPTSWRGPWTATSTTGARPPPEVRGEPFGPPPVRGPLPAPGGRRGPAGGAGGGPPGAATRRWARCGGRCG